MNDGEKRKQNINDQKLDTEQIRNYTSLKFLLNMSINAFIYCARLNFVYLVFFYHIYGTTVVIWILYAFTLSFHPRRCYY